MKRIILCIPVLILFIACNGVKKTQQAINAGDYTNAMNEALQNLSDNKEKKGHQPYILLLEEAFKKNAERELDHIAFLEKDGNEASYETIYKSYVNLQNIQERIRPLLPLRIIEEQRDAEFSFGDYDNAIIDYKDDLSEYLYDNAEGLLANAIRKEDYRKAYDDFVYLNKINPGFEDTRKKIEEAHIKGIDYIEVKVMNNSNQIIPEQLSQELLNFNTYGLDDLWTKYHTNSVKDITYDYLLQVSLNQIDISPEQLREKEIIKEKQVKDGYKFAVDEAGEFVKDSLGNKIKIDKFKTVRGKLRRFTQFKSARVAGDVVYSDFRTDQQINSYPLASEFIFEHEYARTSGDRRAIDDEFMPLLDRVSVPFPTNEQMVYDAGEDLKARLKDILLNHRFK
jgi:hypothetical protein